MALYMLFYQNNAGLNWFYIINLQYRLITSIIPLIVKLATIWVQPFLHSTVHAGQILTSYYTPVIVFFWKEPISLCFIQPGIALFIRVAYLINIINPLKTFFSS